MPDAVLLPVFNEARTVGGVLDAVRGYFSGEVIVVDDGSTDATPRVLAERSDVTVVHLDRNCGYGCALKIGFRVAHDIGVTRLITMDCDGQHEPAHIPQFFSALAEGGDIISGSRYLPESGAGDPAPPGRRAINERDHRSGQRGHRLGPHRRVLRLQGVPAACASSCIRLDEPGYAMPLELWAKAWGCGLSRARDTGRAHLLRPRPFVRRGPRRSGGPLCVLLDVWTPGA